MDQLNSVTKDCFNAIIQVRRLAAIDSAPAPEAVHRRFRGVIEDMKSLANNARYAQDEIESMSFALVALIDEVALNLSDEIRGHWLSRLLQLELFDTNTAGEEFFTRLEAIRRDPRRVDVLRVYYQCLLFGFQGRYRVRGHEVELADIVQQTRSDLDRLLPPSPSELSPDAERPDEAEAVGPRSMPLIWTALSLVVVSLVLLAAYVLLLNGQTQALLHSLTNMISQGS